MSLAANQARTFLRLVAQLRPHWRRDPGLATRIQSLLAGQRAFGARDRRLYRELIYTTLRYLPWIEPALDAHPDEAVRRVAWLAADLPATASFRAAFATGQPPAGDKTELLPAWFRPHCPEIFTGVELDTQLRRAPLWLRLPAAEPEHVLAEFDALGWRWRRSPVLASAIELLAEADVTKTASWRDGRVEIQDLGSQLILASTRVTPGVRWLDACAGAGGKTLQLAARLGPQGRIDAHDIRPGALAELKTRAERAGILDRVRVLSAPPSETYDGVLVDAPCSGSGTWRRAPHLKWTTTEPAVTHAAARQRSLLDAFGARVRPGGQLVYATCSLSSRENEETVAAFLATHPEFSPAPTEAVDALPRGAGRLILPARHDTDGFFFAVLTRA